MLSYDRDHDPYYPSCIYMHILHILAHCFIQFGSTDLFDRWVVQPTITEQANNQTHEFAQAGLPGAIGSMDATQPCCSGACQLQAETVAP
jgi:hypothetical protein